tara:strand:- start:10693 stop:11190 length:498 start_codon:yes stop_codon:yes gene_type:complete
MKKNSSKTTDVDLQLLTNPIFNSSLSEKNNKEKQNHSKNSSNIKLYKKKIFLLTKDFLNNKKSDDPTLNNIFTNYAESCANYLKFKELSKSVQNDYIEYNKNDVKKQNIIEKSKIKEDISKSNNIIMNHIDTKASLLNFVKYKKKAKKTLIIPSVRDISSNFTKI